MINKRLKPCTIIPKDLYVERSADRQIAEIIKDAGRPGYVLVARQMGKTNLLLHTKKKLENNDVVITYIDLSNKFETERDLYQNIIDLTIETHESKLGHLFESFYKRRNETSLPAHKEHERELREILTYVSKLVIILDEVDALTSTSYSDKVFAQVRSVYFSRENFPVLNNLTYILSGVAEPSEIIKDKSISPFNIGQKIFLDDFNKDEFNHFFSLANINIPISIIEHLYYWTNGNPRMTWEIASRVEDKILDGGLLSEELIDDIIYETYLNKKDLPPLDHILDLAETSQTIRSTLMTIHYNKSGALTSEEKNKLYLAGIIGSDFNNISKIKNKILEKALSIEWLEEIERTKKSFYDLAVEKFSSQKYAEAIHFFEKYLEESKNISEDSSRSTYLQLALCYYKIGEYRKSLNCYKNNRFSREGFRDVYFTNLYYEALCYLGLRDLKNAIPLFRECVDEFPDHLLTLKAALNLAASNFILDYKSNKSEVISLNEQVLTALYGFKTETQETRLVKATALFNLGRVYQLDQNKEKSDEYLNQAIDLNIVETLPLFYLTIAKNHKQSQNIEHLKKSIDSIIQNNQIPEKFDYEVPIIFNHSTLEDLIAETIKSDAKFVLPILQYSISNIYKDHMRPHELLKKIANNFEQKENYQEMLAVLKYNFGKYAHDFTLDEEHHTLLFICIFEQLERKKFLHKYITLLKKRIADLILEDLDFKVIFDAISLETNNQKYDEAQSIIDFINSSKSLIGEDYKLNYLLIDVAEINMLDKLHDNERHIKKAKEVISNIRKEYKGKSNIILSQEQISNFEGQLMTLVNNYHQATISKVSSIKKIGRNELVKVRYMNTGDVKDIKYKKIKLDILEGKCEIIELLKN